MEAPLLNLHDSGDLDATWGHMAWGHISMQSS
jgi:hypothetical protein